jgi:phosphoglycerate-specific signal transduction histidine kinase
MVARFKTSRTSGGFIATSAQTDSVPLRVAGVVVGAMLFGTLTFEKQWSELEVQRPKLVAEIFGNAFERKRAEAQIRKLSEELRHLSQVVTMGELTAYLAHKLNQPLGAILNYARAVRRMLAAEKPNLARIDSALEEIIRDDARAVEIVRNVRNLFRRDEKIADRSLDCRESWRKHSGNGRP